jgi:hypothetical protein
MRIAKLNENAGEFERRAGVQEPVDPKDLEQWRLEVLDIAQRMQELQRRIEGGST